MSKKLGQGISLHSQTKQVIANIYNYLKLLADSWAAANLKSIQKTVFEAIRIGRTALSDFIRKEKSLEEGASFGSPTKKREETPVTESDQFIEDAIRRMIYGRTGVKRLLPPEAIRGIWLGMRGLVRSYVKLSICHLSARVVKSASVNKTFTWNIWSDLKR
jgi:hypothetical protein